MSASPRFKVYSPEGEYIACCKYVEDCAALVAMRCGGTIRDGHRKKDIVWDEGHEEFSAGESYDGVAETVYARIEAKGLRVEAHS